MRASRDNKAKDKDQAAILARVLEPLTEHII